MGKGYIPECYDCHCRQGWLKVPKPDRKFYHWGAIVVSSAVE